MQFAGRPGAEKQWRTGARFHEYWFISEDLCFRTAPPAKEAAASLALAVCWDTLGEKERPRLEPSASCRKGWPCLAGKDQSSPQLSTCPFATEHNAGLSHRLQETSPQLRKLYIFPLGKILSRRGSLIVRPAVCYAELSYLEMTWGAIARTDHLTHQQVLHVMHQWGVHHRNIKTRQAGSTAVDQNNTAIKA